MTWLLVTWCPLVALLWRFWASFPGFHIAQFHYQVIGNCGVISLMRCSNGPVKTRMAPASKIKLRIVFCYSGHGFFGGTATTIAGWRCAQYDSIVALAACAYLERGPGVSSMMVVVLVAGIGLLLAGILAIAFGIPVKEFSFGNTLILVGAIAACTGMMMLGLWTAVRELKNIARRLGPGVAVDQRAASALQPAAVGPTLGNQAPAAGGFFVTLHRPAPQFSRSADPAATSAVAPPWLEEAASRGRSDVPPPEPEPVEAAPAAKPRRNLMFSSTSRKERERAHARTREPPAPDFGPGPAAAPPAFEPSEAPPATFDDAWPKSERARSTEAPPPRRSGRTPSTFTNPVP